MVLGSNDDHVSDPRATDQRFPAVEPPVGSNCVPIGQLLAASAIGVGDRYDLGSTVGGGQIGVRPAAVARPDDRNAHRLCHTASLESPSLRARSDIDRRSVRAMLTDLTIARGS
jgi:hypothetical protein